MSAPPDARIPITVVADQAALAASLAPGQAPAGVLLAGKPPAMPPPGAAMVDAAGPEMGRHAFGCACCAGRPPIALALDRMFQARVRGRCPWFERVVVLAESPADRRALARCLAEDALTAARYRPAEAG